MNIIRAINAVGVVVGREDELWSKTIAEAVRIDAAVRRDQMGLPLDPGDLERTRKYEGTCPRTGLDLSR